MVCFSRQAQSCSNLGSVFGLQMQKIGQPSIISMLAFSYLSKSHNNIYCLPILHVGGPEFLCRRVGAVTILLGVGSRIRTYFSWGQICKASTHYFLSLYIKIHKMKKCPQMLLFTLCGKINKMAISYIKEYSLKLDWLFLYLNLLLILQIVVEACCSNLYSHPLYLRECIQFSSVTQDSVLHISYYQTLSSLPVW